MKIFASDAIATPDENLKTLRISNDADLGTLAAEGALQGVERIELDFPKFTDGRAFSQAVLLRRRHGFAGDLRATGDVLIDQLVHMHRSGFTSAVLAEGGATPQHLSMELFKSANSVFLTHIPYRGTAPAVTDLLGAQVDVMFLPIHVALPHIRAGKLVALGIGSDKRHSLLPTVPTLAEAKAGDDNVAMWYGIFAPPGTAADMVQRLNRELKDILTGADVRAAFETQGMDPASSTPDEFRRLVEQDATRWAQLIRTQNITAE